MKQLIPFWSVTFLLTISFKLDASPFWVWPENKAGPVNTPTLGYSFSLDEKPVAARLRAVGDFALVSVIINGQWIAETPFFGQPIEVDVANRLRKGKNRLILMCKATDGPSAVATEIRWKDAEGKEHGIGTDQNWASKSGELKQTGDLGLESWWRAPGIIITETDDYNQWEEAKTAKGGADPTRFFTLPGFEVELLHSATDGEGSWVSCAFDTKGRLGIGREDSGILRFTFSEDRSRILKNEWLLRSVKENRGLVYAHGALYVNANSSNGIYRFRDTNGDGQFNEEKKLFDIPGGRGHGRNGLALGPDGLIYAIMGDSVKLPFHIPGLIDRTSPLRQNQKVFRPNEGHLFRFDKDGKKPTIIAAGLRNPYGIEFNADGEAFTFDADAEFDMGAPWYRPTQVKHLTSGSDFGWRAVTGSWPPYDSDHPDNAQPTVHIGKSSPTGILSGSGSLFPKAYRDALFILDWTYGRILAVHLTPNGAGYRGRPEVFLRGRPLNVTDADIGPDGAMYFVTGGRGTQSALYRVSYQGRPRQPKASTVQEIARNKASEKSRRARRKLENLHRLKTGSLQGETLIRGNIEDPLIRYAARIGFEHQIASGSPLIIKNTNGNSPALVIAKLTALIHSDSKQASQILIDLNKLALKNLPVAWLESALQVYRLCLPALSAVEKSRARGKLRTLFPHRSTVINRQLAELLLRLEDSGATPATLSLLREAPGQHDRMHYLFLLRNANKGWTLALRREYFQHLAESRNYLGGRGLPGFIDKIHKDAVAGLTDDEKTALGNLITRSSKTSLPPMPELSHRKFVQAWTMKDFKGEFKLPEQTGVGASLFEQGLCSRCHRVGSQGVAIGPDLSAVGNRFSPRDLLEAILEPSMSVAENYQTHILELNDGSQLTGQIIPQLDYRSRHLLLAPNPVDPDKTIKVPKAGLKTHRRSDFSIMPPGLLNTFSRKEVITLIAWLRKGEK